MPFRHDYVISGGNKTKLHKLAEARDVDTGDILCEALRNYLAQPELFNISMPLYVDGANIYCNCTLPDGLRNALDAAAKQHTVKPMGHATSQTVFTRAIIHYFNQLAAENISPVDNTPPTCDATPHYVRIMTQAARNKRKFKV